MAQSAFVLNTGDGLRLSGRRWPTEAAPRGVICLVHGLGEHSGRYDALARYLNRRAYTVLAIDLRGHGYSEGRRGDITSYDTLMSDIACLLEYAQLNDPPCPRFLYGHSMGGNLVLNCAARRPVALSGVIASAPLLRTAFAPPRWRMILGEGMRHLWPTRPMASGLNVDDLSRDPAVVDAYRSDPLVHDRVTPRFLDVLRAGEWITAHAARLSFPLLLMHGSADRITSAQASLEFASGSGRNCTVKIWEGLAHEIHNEPEKEQVLAFVADWIEGQVLSESSPMPPAE